MQGQWRGFAKGDNNGQVFLNLDLIGEDIKGHVVLWESDPALPGIVADVEVEKKNTTLNVTALNVRPLDPANGLVLDPQRFKTLYPEIRVSNSIHVTAELDIYNNIIGSYSTDTELSGTLQLTHPQNLISTTYAEEISWDSFKALLWQNTNKRFLYRGQCNRNWPLRTTFHRSGRADLLRYYREDLPRLYRHVHALTSLKFDFNDNNDIGALLYLAQHHGFPTPLLDWTLSPFVAAYFAFKDAPLPSKDCSHARIFIFDKEAWRKNNFQSPYYHSHGPTITYNELLASGNNRAMPQQAVTTFSNIDYIEAVLNRNITHETPQYLSAYDIPLEEKDSVLRDLRFMGITGGALFPDLDGICKDLKEQYFD